MFHKPKISICAPVYNGEKYLAAFLESALCQSFNDYEIVVADNQSIDDSMEVLRKYQLAYPERISIYQTLEHGGPGKGRNLAIQHARGEYVFLCDSDDLIHPMALEKLYEEAIRYDSDMVRGYAMVVYEEDGEVVKVSPYGKTEARAIGNEYALSNCGVEFWLHLFKKDLLERVGPMPEDIIFDDVRYMKMLQASARNIRILDFPVYYWYKRGASTTSTIRKELCEDSTLAAQYTLENAELKYIEACQYYVANRANDGRVIRWPYFDLYVNEICSYHDWIYKNKRILKNKTLYGELRWVDGMAGTQLPNIVYIDGFSKLPSSERIQELQEKVFHDGCEIIALSENNCDVNENEYISRAYKKGEKSFVCTYFALKKIYENGGIFIHDNIRILNYFGYLKYQNAFFSLIDKNSYSEWIFGSPAKNEAIKSILNTYSFDWDKKGKYMPLSKRIAIILTAKYQIPLDGKERLFQKVVSVLSPELSVVDTSFGNTTKKCAFEHDYSAYAGDDAFVTIPRSSLRVLLEKDNTVVKSVNGKSQREIELERELIELKKSNIWKVVVLLRNLGDGPYGPFLKKIFRGIQKMKTRFVK